MSKTVDLGPVSAYALAVKYGYTGTEAEWAAEMESKRLEAVTAASNAQSAATAASQSQIESANSATASDNSATASADSATAASGSATLAESYTHGGTGVREDEGTDNARYYMEQAKAVSAVDIMTVDRAGIGKPDGTTITVDEDGTMHGQSKVDEMTGATADADGTSGTVPAPMAGQENRVLKGNGAWEALAYDSELSAESENAPQTKVVDAKTKEIEENLSQLSNPNLLINPDFKINQRNRYGSGISHEFVMDRWFSPYGLTDCTYDNSLQALHVHAGVNEGLEQRLEDCSNLLGKKVTLSICYKSTGPVVLSGILTFSDSTNSHICVSHCEPTDSFVIKSVTGYVKPEAVNARFGFSLGNFDVWVKWIKLELGSVATPFVPPDPASELAKCQRYGFECGIDDTNEGYPLTVQATEQNVAFGLLPIPETMRTTPTISKQTLLYCFGRFNTGFSNSVQMHLSAVGFSNNAIQIRATIDDNLFVAGNVYTVYFSRPPKSLFFDAEIY